ncbi:serine hydrolase domain-containing protein [Polymorphospora rubra]|uniref:serine hydrolase domain-containing protein n=1 Tax=Polymorphospora rubra TaxID=338584 RepID=UPI0033E9AF61
MITFGTSCTDPSQGRVTFDDPVSTWLDAAVLDGLFVVDRTTDVTLGQLLSHTSGAADYFEGPVVSGSPMIEVITTNPDRLFTPTDLLAFSRDHQKPVAAPGTQRMTSDATRRVYGNDWARIEREWGSQHLDEPTRRRSSRSRRTSSY